jgi:nucleoside-diphosphate-sugar epimerase
MRIAVAGATGNIGARTAAALERDGHDVVRISRSLGVDLITGEGLDASTRWSTPSVRHRSVRMRPVSISQQQRQTSSKASNGPA